MTFLKELTISIVAVLALIYGITGAIQWSENHDKAVEKASDTYVVCVETQFHMSPATYFAQHREYPVCN